MMNTAENMFKEAALLQLNATCWHIDKKLPQVLLSEIGNIDYLRGRKLILPEDSTSLIKQVIGKARNYLRRIALPFPINGCVLVPRKLIPEIQEELRKLETEYKNRVYAFLYGYPYLIESARKQLGELFDSCDYPTREQVEKRFHFQWRYIVIGPSVSRVLPPSIYKDEVKKFQNLMEQAREEAITALRQEFVELVANITDKLSGSADGKPKRLRDSAITNLHEFLDSFASRNMFADDQLEELVNQCRNVISNTSINEIRTSQQVKENLHDSMVELMKNIDSAFENLPRRKIRFAA